MPWRATKIGRPILPVELRHGAPLPAPGRLGGVYRAKSTRNCGNSPQPGRVAADVSLVSVSEVVTRAVPGRPAAARRAPRSCSRWQPGCRSRMLRRSSSGASCPMSSSDVAGAERAALCTHRPHRIAKLANTGWASRPRSVSPAARSLRAWNHARDTPVSARLEEIIDSATPARSFATSRSAAHHRRRLDTVRSRDRARRSSPRCSRARPCRASSHRRARRPPPHRRGVVNSCLCTRSRTVDRSS